MSLLPRCAFSHCHSCTAGHSLGSLPPWETNPAGSAAYLACLICIIAGLPIKGATFQRKAKPLQNVFTTKQRPCFWAVGIKCKEMCNTLMKESASLLHLGTKVST